MPTRTRLYFFPQQGGAVLKCLPQNTADAKGLELKRVWSDLWSALIRHFLCEHWNSVKNSYVFGLNGLECRCASVCGTGASDEKFCILIHRLWQKSDSGYLISSAPKGLTDISPVIQRLQFQCQL